MTKGPSVTIVDSKIPEPGPEQVVIKVVVSGSNPKDWWVTLVSHTHLYRPSSLDYTDAQCIVLQLFQPLQRNTRPSTNPSPGKSPNGSTKR